MTDVDESQQATKALDALRDSFERATSLARTVSLDRGLDMADTIREIVETATLLRYEILVRMYEAEGHSTTRLGERAGLTKQRADQLVKQAVKAGIKPSPKK